MKTNWQTKKLGEVCEFTRGLTYSKSDEVLFSNNVVLRANNVNYLSNVLDLSEIRYIKDSFEIPENKKVKKDSLLICTASGSKEHLGKVALIDKDYNFAFGGFMGQITPKNGVESKYLYYFFVSAYYKEYILKLTGGTNINNLKFSDIENIEIPLPPLQEQKRIVKILDEAFEKLKKVKENTEKNLQNSKELFESYLNNIFSNPGKDWEYETIEKHVKFIDYRGKTPKKTKEGIRLITAKNVKLGYIQLQPEEFIAENNYDTWMTRGIPSFGDVIFTTEAPLANVAQINTKEKLAFAQRIIIMSPDKKINQDFLKYLLLSTPVRKRIFEKATGATVSGIKASLLKNIEIYFPKSIQEQKQIVKKLDQLSGKTQKLESLYKQKLESIEELKKSILSKAFSGEL
jgi:type I restriction enzyme S subunit